MTTTFRSPSPPPDDPEPYVSLPYAAERYKVTRWTIRRLISAGTIPGYRFGPRAIRVRMSEVEAALRIIPAARRDDDHNVA